MASLSDLNDDCLAAVLEYWPSPLLFACISSNGFKNKQLRRCALDLLSRSCGPFRLMSKFATSGGDVTRFMALEDAKRTERCELKPPYGHAASPLAEHIESAEIPLFYNYAGGDVSARLDLVKALPSVKSLAVRVLVHKDSPPSFSSSFSKLAAQLGPLFAELRSFAIVGPVILPGQGIDAVLEMINQMPQVVSLKIPSYLLSPLLVRLPAKAKELHELILYRNHNGDRISSCDAVINELRDADLAELSHLKYSCRPHSYGARFSYNPAAGGHTCIESFTLRRSPKLCTLTLDIDSEFASLETISSLVHKHKSSLMLGRGVSLSELNVTLRQKTQFDVRSGWTRWLFGQFADVRTLRVSVGEVDALLFNVVHCAVNSNRRMASSLRDFSFESSSPPPDDWPPLWSGEPLPVAFLSPEWRGFGQLERLTITGVKADLSGFTGDLCARDRFRVTNIIRLLRSCRSLKFAKLCAKIDSPEALKTWLPAGCNVVDVIERPCEDAQGCFVLQADKYWRPVEILVSVNKDAVSHVSETATFVLRLIVP